MLRSDLLERLQTVSPALSNKDIIPILTHFWFTGKELMAFNDQIAISLPCKTDFNGAVPGKVMLEILKNSKAKNIELLAVDSSLTIKAASSKVKMPILASDNFSIFEMPKVDKDDKYVPLDISDFIAGLECCMRSIGIDTSMPDQLGVTLIADGDKAISMYSTNNNTISYASIPLKKKYTLKNRIVLSSTFCQQVMSMCKGISSARLYLGDGYALLQVSDKHLFGRLIDTDSPTDFKGMIEHHFPVTAKKKLIPIPTKMQLILERAVIAASAGIEVIPTNITVNDGKIKFVTKHKKLEMVDYLTIGDGHPNVNTRIQPKHLKAGYGYFDKMMFTESCAIMTKGDFIYMIAAIGE